MTAEADLRWRAETMPGYLQSCPRPQTQAGETVLSDSSTNRYALLTGAPRSANATCIMPAHVIDGAGHETRGVPWLLQCLPLWRAHLSRSADAKHPMTFMSKVDLPLGGETKVDACGRTGSGFHVLRRDFHVLRHTRREESG